METGTEPRVPAEGGQLGGLVFREQLPFEEGRWRCVWGKHGSGDPVFQMRASSRQVEQAEPRAHQQKQRQPRLIHGVLTRL